MCQMRVVMDSEAGRETILDAATKLEVSAAGITLHAFLDPPRLIAGATIREIDFLEGLAVLMPKTGDGR